MWIVTLTLLLVLSCAPLTSGEDRRSASLKSLQLTQNRLLRALNNSKIKDNISTKSLLTKFNLLSVNQLAAQIKLTEVWKSVNVDGNPLKLELHNKTNRADMTQALRPKTNRVYEESSRLEVSKMSFHIDAARLWNRAPFGGSDSTKSCTGKGVDS